MKDIAHGGLSALAFLPVPFFPIWVGHLQELRTCQVLAVIDGDSLEVACRAMGPQEARLIGFDTPEIYGACSREVETAKQARNALRHWSADPEFRVTYDRAAGRDKYGRLLVQAQLQGRPIAEWMIEADLARPYHGGRRQGWCG